MQWEGGRGGAEKFMRTPPPPSKTISGRLSLDFCLYFGWGGGVLTAIEIHSPSLGNIALIVSGFTGIGDSYICWLRKECIKGEAIADLFGSSIEIQTESELTRPDFECESSNA